MVFACSLVSARIFKSSTNHKELDMRPVVLVGHRHSCPIHGDGTVVSGAESAAINGRAIARVGDRISCGAEIQTGSPGTEIEGQPVAREGDTTSHGGTLVEGEAGWQVE
ncbi:PAAR domain-containing protein [Burkholderia cepacia]|uniref:PAAR domain-containing protein n=1 Tax=Burkholderia cepacia TaxID=292 RepID=UPI002ED9746B